MIIMSNTDDSNKLELYEEDILNLLNDKDILLMKEDVDIYKKTPFVRTALLGSIIYEVTNIFNHFVLKENSFTNYLNENINFFNTTIIPHIKEISSYTYENTSLSILIASGVGFGWYCLEKVRSYIPKNSITHLPTNPTADEFKAVKEINYNLDKKHSFIEDKIEMISNRIKPFIYASMAITAGVSIISGTYGSFFKENLNVIKDFKQVADNYSTIFFSAGVGVGYFSLKKLTEYTVNMGRGFYEKYLFVKNKFTSLNKEKKEIYNKAEEENRIRIIEFNKYPRSEQVKFFESLIKKKKTINQTNKVTNKK